jgi:DHA1 family bicyclomycin/chloramphenicol resistance-like MFS transporter
MTLPRNVRHVKIHDIIHGQRRMEAMPQHVKPRRDLTLLLSFIIAVGPISVDMYLPAFSQIARDFHDQSVPQLTLAWYSIGFASGQIIFGPLSDWKGRRPALIGGLALYIFASLGCALSPGPVSLCACRMLAAFGGSASIVVTRALIFDLETGDAAARLLSSVFAWMMIAPLIAPPLGSLLLLVSGWRAIFVAAAAYGVTGLVLFVRFVPETLNSAHRLPIGPRRLAVRTIAILGERGFLTNALIGAFAMFALFTLLGGSPVVFMNQYGFSPTFYSWLLVLIAVATIVMLRLNRRLIGRPGWGFGRAVNLDIVLFLAGSLCLIPLVWWSLSWQLVLLGMVVSAAGFTCIQPNVQPAALSAHQAHKGSAQALMSTLQYGGGAVATALLGWLADGTGRPMTFLMLLAAVGALTAAGFRPRERSPP